jgi:hypothetical protein
MLRVFGKSALDRLSVLVLLVAVATFGANPARAAGSDKHDPCSFLTVDEIEAIMGKLAGPPYRAGGGATPRLNGSDCRYEAPDRRSIRLNVTWDGGKQLIDMMSMAQKMVETAGLKQLKLLDGTTVAGHWDQAAVNSCCEFNALRGDQVVTVDISGSRATIAQAASLADAAVQRLDQPLAISGAPGVKPAQERATQRPKPRNVCDLLTQAEAEAIAGVSLLQPPKGSEGNCHYIWPLNTQDSTYELNLMVTWREGFSEMRTTSAAVGNASAMLGMDKLLKTPADPNAGPWDEFFQSIIGVTAVKGDVMVSVEGGPIKRDVQRAFVEKAIVNLSK